MDYFYLLLRVIEKMIIIIYWRNLGMNWSFVLVRYVNFWYRIIFLYVCFIIMLIDCYVEFRFKDFFNIRRGIKKFLLLF